MDFRKDHQRYKKLIERALARLVGRQEPRSVYDPIQYILHAGGKRVRPTLTLLACEAVGGRAEQALDAAVAVEVLHSFTLVHDDIMDNADTRRGRLTIHKKWDHNVAILAGDQMIALAYRSLLSGALPSARDVMRVFTDAFIEVCEGQGLDKEFETRRDVTVREYMKMIDKKTAKVMSCAAAIGAIIGGGSDAEVRALRTYGSEIGRAFQLRDDLLDIVADSKLLGKAVGGDLREGKKTYLLLRGIEQTRGREQALLQRVARRSGIRAHDIQTIKEIFQRHGIIADAQALIHRCTRRAQRAIKNLHPSQSREMLMWYADELLGRIS